MALIRIVLVLCGLAFGLTPVSAKFLHGTGPATGLTQISNLNIGGGGFVTGFDMASDGTMLARVDIFGGYVGSTVVGTTWQQLITQTSMPSAYTSTPNPFFNGGLWEVRIDPNNSSTFYGMYSLFNAGANSLTYLLKSTNKGVSWIQTGLPANTTNSQDSTRYLSGQKIAVDPNNSNNVWASTYTGLYFSSNGGTTFAALTTGGAGQIATASGAPGYVGMQFDPATPNRMLVGVTGAGVYVSTNANLGTSATWTLVTGTGTLTNPAKAKVGSDGYYYFSLTSEAATLYRIDPSNVLTPMTANSAGINEFAVDPNNPARAVAIIFGQIAIGGTVNGTFSWGAKNANYTVSATDAPWQATLANSGPKSDAEVYFDPFKTTSPSSATIGTGTVGPFTVSAGLNIANGDLLRITNTGTPGNYMLGTATYSGTSLSITVLASDPGGYLGTKTGGSGTFSAWTITKERLWLSTGFGMFWTDGLYATAAYTWNSMNLGIESLVARQVIWPTGNVPMLASADIPVWQVPTNPVGATTGLAAFGPNTSAPVIEGQAIDWVKSTPTEIVMVSNNSQSGTLFKGKNLSSGAAGSWASFAIDPGGNSVVAASDANTIVVASSAAVQYTTNGAASGTWAAVPSWPTTGWSASAPAGNSMNPEYQGICADTVTANTFYGYNSNGNVYKFVSSGPTGSTVATGINPGSGSFAPILKCAPGNAGHLFWTAGTPISMGGFTFTSLATLIAGAPNSTDSPFKFSNGGGTWTALTNVAGVIAFGFTAAKPGQSYPAIVIAGWVSGSYGIWRCDVFDPTNATTVAASCDGHWNNVGTFARGWIDDPTSLEGDPSQWGRFIIGHNGTGFAIGQVSGQTNAWP